MMRAWPLSVLVFAGLSSGCTKSEPPGASAEARTTSALARSVATAAEPSEAKLAAFAPLPPNFDSAANPGNDARVSLGRALFFDPRLSRNQDRSCNSCHDLERHGVDGERFSVGHRGQLGTRNSPTVFNAAGQVAQFWDGREPDVESQAKGPMMNPVEMAMPKPGAVVAMLASIPAYGPAFAAAFPGERPAVTLEHATKAIGAFERKLATPSRWDRFLGGDRAALSDDEKAGFDTFYDTGCPTCHSGALVGGAMFQKLGVAIPWADTHDEGRFGVTKLDADRMVFKVPSLRNVEKTAPYFHDGSVATLSEAVRLMAHHQLGKELDDAAAGRIVTWLGALTGEPPSALVAAPALAPSGPATPRPVSN